MKEYKELVTALGSLIVLIFTVAGIFTKVIGDSQLLRYVIILSYVVFAGGILWFAFKNTQASEKQKLLSLVFLWLVTPFLLLWTISWTEQETAIDPCTEYGITITEPINGYTPVNGQVTIQGRFTRRPPDKSLQLVGVGGGQYWPFDVNQMELTNTGWSGRSHGQGDYRAVIVYVGENGRILFDHYIKAGLITDDYSFGIDKLPDDVVECGSVYIPVP